MVKGINVLERKWKIIKWSYDLDSFICSNKIVTAENLLTLLLLSASFLLNFLVNCHTKTRVINLIHFKEEMVHFFPQKRGVEK